METRTGREKNNNCYERGERGREGETCRERIKRGREGKKNRRERKEKGGVRKGGRKGERG